MNRFRLRLNYVDHYLAAPSDFDPPVYHDGARAGSVYPKVPVIRVFGATPTGQKACVHVHGMFPYLYIEYSGGTGPEDVEAHIHRLHLSMDYALGVSYRRRAGPDQPSYIAHISLVKGVPFYGYYVGYRLFLKIYLFNPHHIIRLADLLRQGAILSRAIQPFESHMQYVPQWMCDFNLFGCDYLNCDKVMFRSPVPQESAVSNPTDDWHSGTIAAAMVSDPRLQRKSHCALEADICVWDILNRLEVKARPTHHRFMEALTSVESDEKLVTSMAGLWRDETRRRKARLGLDDNDGTPFSRDVLVSVSADPRNSNPGGWIHEDVYREQVHRQVQMEKSAEDSSSFAASKLQEPDSAIPTSFESIKDLFPANLLRTAAACKTARDRSSGITTSEREAIDVDEQQARSFETDPDVEADLLEAFNDGESDDEPPIEDDADQTPAQPDESSTPLQKQPSPFRHANAQAKKRRQTSPLPPGVRVAGDYADEDKDLFEIPPGYSSDIIGTIERYARFEREDQSSRREQKRHKVIHIEADTEKAAFPLMTVKYDDQPDPTWQQPPPSTQPTSRMPERPPSTPRRSKEGPALDTSSGELDVDPIKKLVANMASFGVTDASKLLVLNSEPPQSSDILDDLARQGLPSVAYQEAHYSRAKDVPTRGRIYGGREFKIPGTTLAYLPDFDPTGLPPLPNRAPRPIQPGPDASCTLRTWEIARVPPSWSEVEDWLNKKRQVSDGLSDNQSQLSQIDAPTQNQKYGFKYSQKKPSKNITVEAQYMTIMSLEVHVNSRGELLPNPEFDEVTCVFWCLQSEHGGEDLETHDQVESGIIILAAPGEQMSYRIRRSDARVDEESNELDLINRLIDIVRDLDPDILTGFEVHDSSWGFLIERARRKYEFSLCDELSRIRSDSHGRFGRAADRWGFNQTSTVHITGRHVINIWRAMRGELDLLQYTMENVAFHVLHRRIPHYAHADLTRWWKGGRPFELSRVIDYWLSRAKIDLEILERNELVARTSEQARLLGVDFYAVFARGSQFKVESLMSRIAKPESLILISPSRKQVGQQNALECLPLVMEPRSDFYTSPVLVLDFQSLYPSVMIAYNYCYSTFLGRVVPWRGQNKMGFTEYERPPGLLDALEDRINIAPNGIMYAKPTVRKSLLAKMLSEILETRVMVKSGMKMDTEDRQLQRLLNNRQLALKLIANVTYGYTSASYSGRMPCSEIADSVVQTARETLERSIALIHSVRKWRAEVVYGDTDSLFVLLRGRTRAQAFAIGQEIADSVTEMNPRPVKLKFEKVYHPCVLLAKKRYVGFKYEHPDQVEPEFDAKGIETVRRDGTPAEQKIEETALKTLFRTADLSQVKAYMQRQFRKIMQGRVSVQDFCFAKEVKLGTYSDKGVPPPGALVASRRMAADPRAEPQYGERVPYVVVTGAPGARLIDRCVSPEVLLQDDAQELDAEYYISKNLIPPLERILNLVGADVRGWYDEMPKIKRIRRVAPRTSGPPSWRGRGGPSMRGTRGRPSPLNPARQMQGTLVWNGAAPVKRTLESYLISTTCVLCGSKGGEPSGSRRGGRRAGGRGSGGNGSGGNSGRAGGNRGRTGGNISGGNSRPTNRPTGGLDGGLCAPCQSQPAVSLFQLRQRLQAAEHRAGDIHMVCRSCSGLAFGQEVRCDSKDCPVFYSRAKQDAKVRNEQAVLEPAIAVLTERLDRMLGW